MGELNQLENKMVSFNRGNFDTIEEVAKDIVKFLRKTTDFKFSYNDIFKIIDDNTDGGANPSIDFKDAMDDFVA